MSTVPHPPPPARILLVDDSEAVTHSVRTFLEAYGHTVQEENSALRSVQTARRFLPDLVVLDIRMPGRDGGSVLEAFRRDPALAAVPVIFLTGLMELEETGDGIEREGCLYLSKQARFSVLARAIHRLLAAARTTDAATENAPAAA